jgi:NADH dehydrogenase (ubiquinone) 1 alpha subcomplex subunit 6
MTTIPTRLARAAAVSTGSAHQRNRVLDLYREWMRGVRLPFSSAFYQLSKIPDLLPFPSLNPQRNTRAQAPEICTLYSLDVPPSAVRAVIRQRFEKNRYVADTKVIDILIHKSRQEYQETMNFWKQEPHVLGPLLSNRDRAHRSFLQKFLEGGLSDPLCVTAPALT